MGRKTAKDPGEKSPTNCPTPADIPGSLPESLPVQVFLRLRARNLARNESVFTTNEPLLVDLSEPVGKLIGVVPGSR